MINQLKNAKTFEEWQERAKELDKYLSKSQWLQEIYTSDSLLLENDQWINKPESKIYDYKLIKSRLEHQRKAREIGDVDNMMYLLRVGLLRNFGGICDRRLFSHAYVG